MSQCGVENITNSILITQTPLIQHEIKLHFESFLETSENINNSVLQYQLYLRRLLKTQPDMAPALRKERRSLTPNAAVA